MNAASNTYTLLNAVERFLSCWTSNPTPVYDMPGYVQGVR